MGKDQDETLPLLPSKWDKPVEVEETESSSIFYGDDWDGLNTPANSLQRSDDSDGPRRSFERSISSSIHRVSSFISYHTGKSSFALRVT